MGVVANIGVVASIERLKEDGWTLKGEEGRKELWQKEKICVLLDIFTGEFSDIFPLNSELEKLKSANKEEAP